jgi:hypothetical protein
MAATMRDDTLRGKLATAKRNLAFLQNLLRTCPADLWRIRTAAENDERTLSAWIKKAEAKLAKAAQS